MDETVHGMDRPVRRSRWQSKPLRAGIAAAIAAAGIVVVGIKLGDSQRSLRVASRDIVIATVEHGQFRDFVPLRARVVPRDVVYLDAQEGGRVERVRAEAGDVVTAGQPLIEFGNTDLQLQVIEREARLIEEINNLRSIQMSLEQNRIANERALAELDYNLVRLRRLADRRNSLATRGALSEEEKDKVQDELAHYTRLRPLVAESNAQQEALRLKRLPEIRDGLEKLQQNLVITRGKLDNLVVRAPISGRLTALDLKVGENCDRGQRLAEITPDTGFKLAADIDEFYLDRVRVNQQAQVQIGSSGAALTVTRVYPQVKDNVFTIDLAFAEPAPTGLIAGQALQGRLRLGGDHPATLLPAGAFLEQTGGDWVFVVTSGGRSAQRRRIKVARRNAEQIEIASGLAVGERVIVSAYRGWERIDRIELVN